jgi:glutamate-ammonia-ligase adenylyltransferase
MEIGRRRNKNTCILSAMRALDPSLSKTRTPSPRAPAPAIAEVVERTGCLGRPISTAAKHDVFNRKHPMQQMPEPTPETNDAHWRQWLAWAAEHGVAVPSDAAFATARAQVWEASEFVALTCVRHPQLFAALLAEDKLAPVFSAKDLTAELSTALAGVGDEAGLHHALRLFRRRRMLRIVWRDLSGWATLDETLAELSALADACIREALAVRTRWTGAELGVPMADSGDGPQRQSLVVLGMGKLGAGELNLSSDVDLIFAFPMSGSVRGGRRPLSNEQFFARLCQRLIKALDAPTVDGFVFRVDTRLRPFGTAGPLAMSFSAMEAYYHAQAREWERYAMTKARVIVGEAEPAAELTALLRPFVYRRYLDFGAIESLRSLKTAIDRELKRKGMADNIKLGPGGIREIEFIGQSFQLIRGGRDPDLQVRPIQSVLALLADKGLLNPNSVAALVAAYRFLRLTENRLQGWQDRQVHVLPTAPETRLRLARSMGFADWTAFARALDRHRNRVQAEFDGIFAEPPASDGNTHPTASIWNSLGDHERLIELLSGAGFGDPEGASAALQGFRDNIGRRGLTSRAETLLGVVMPHLIRESAAAEGPDTTLPRVLTVMEAISKRTAYLALLGENPGALHQLVLLCSKSPWFAARTARQPLLLDELLDPRRLFAPLQREALEEELAGLLAAVAPDDQEQRMERLRQFVQGNQLRVAAADATGAIPLMVVSDYLTEIAEVATARSLRITWEDLTARHGAPPGTDAEHPGFVVLGYGKLGGIELGYNSDLDLVFLYDENTRGRSTDGAQPVSSEQFYVRLGQRLLHVMSTPTYSGVLYELDLRLRPDGSKGMIARSLASFSDYQDNAAWTWEHQALVRARPVAGDARLGARFADIRTRVLRRTRDPNILRDDVQAMRGKMRSNLDKTRADLFDLKQGRGGIADVEFMVQYAVLRWAATHPAVTDWTDNIRLLDTLHRQALLPGDAADELTEAYKALRAAYHRNALQDTPGLISAAELVEPRARVAGWWDSLMESPVATTC